MVTPFKIVAKPRGNSSVIAKKEIIAITHKHRQKIMTVGHAMNGVATSS